jgi:hypothetical protein
MRKITEVWNRFTEQIITHLNCAWEGGKNIFTKEHPWNGHVFLLIALPFL